MRENMPQEIRDLLLQEKLCGEDGVKAFLPTALSEGLCTSNCHALRPGFFIKMKPGLHSLPILL